MKFRKVKKILKKFREMYDRLEFLHYFATLCNLLKSSAISQKVLKSRTLELKS